MGYSVWGRKESDMNEHAWMQIMGLHFLIKYARVCRLLVHMDLAAGMCPDLSTRPKMKKHAEPTEESLGAQGSHISRCVDLFVEAVSPCSLGSSSPHLGTPPCSFSPGEEERPAYGPART